MTPRTGRGDLGVGQRKGMTLGLTGFNEELNCPIAVGVVKTDLDGASSWAEAGLRERGSEPSK